MKLGMPTLLETKDIMECIALCKELNLDFIELNMNFPQYQVDQIDIPYYESLLRDHNLFFTIHLEEELNVCGYNPEVRNAYIKTVLATIELAKRLEVPIINMHMATGIYITLPHNRTYLFQEYKEQYLEKLKEFRNLCDKAISDSGIRICIENSGGYQEFSRDGIELLLESKVFALTFDIGHDHVIGGKDEPFIRGHKHRLMHMHIHDAVNNKNHLTLGEGEIDLKEKLALAKECNCRCVLETKTIAALKESVHKINDYLI